MSWQTVKLHEVCDLHNGHAFKSKDYVEYSNTLNCRMSNIRPDGSFDLSHNPKFLPDEYAKKYEKYLLEDEDIVIAMTDMANEPKILGVPTVVNTKGKNLLLNQRVGKLVIKNSDKVYIPYLQYALNQKRVRNYYKKFAGGGLQINLGKNDLLSVSIPLPPLSEQKRIASILDKADALRQKRKQTIAKLDELLQSVFLEMFGDPVTNPKGWKTKTISEICRLVRGSSPRPKNDPKYYGGPVPRLMVADLTRDGWFTTPKIDSLTIDGAKKSRPVKSGTIVMAVSGNVGLVSRLQVDACIHDGFVAF